MRKINVLKKARKKVIKKKGRMDVKDNQRKK
jgi:hypothetical protein